MERTIGTVTGGLLGLATTLVGHGFGQDSDIVFTGHSPPFAAPHLAGRLHTECCIVFLLSMHALRYMPTQAAEHAPCSTRPWQACKPCMSQGAARCS